MQRKIYKIKFYDDYLKDLKQNEVQFKNVVN